MAEVEPDSAATGPRTFLTPTFSIVVVDCEWHTPRDAAGRGVATLLAQEFRDFEVIFVHDGFKRVPYESEFDLQDLRDVKTVYTRRHFHDWGHSLRSLGMRIADGRYVLNFNIDNILSRNCLSRVAEVLTDQSDAMDVVIFSILNHKRGGTVLRTGNPAVVGNIDCLQLVASIEAWRSIGYWYRTDYEADGHLYAELASRFPSFYINEVLGENFQLGKAHHQSGREPEHWTA